MTTTEVEAPTRRIYVASSWRNTFQPAIIHLLRTVPTFEVYDFKDADGFHWSSVAGVGWEEAGPEEYLSFVDHPLAVKGYDRDFAAMEWADTFVLVLPCGRSAHLELGWAVGAGKETAILLSEDGFEAELMYRMVDHMVTTPFDLLGVLGVED